eukprot:m.211419 g.211419  ORF g.211419 m.211419 type:complete len:106 (-) comp15493_c0_seq2:323-640(-)
MPYPSIVVMTTKPLSLTFVSSRQALRYASGVSVPAAFQDTTAGPAPFSSLKNITSVAARKRITSIKWSEITRNHPTPRLTCTASVAVAQSHLSAAVIGDVERPSV